MFYGCMLQGQSITPDMPGICRECTLYLNSCLPVVDNGFLVGAECDDSYCEFCPNYEWCGK